MPSGDMRRAARRDARVVGTRGARPDARLAPNAQARSGRSQRTGSLAAAMGYLKSATVAASMSG